MTDQALSGAGGRVHHRPMTTAGSGPMTIDHLAVLADLQSQLLATIPLVDPRTRVPWCGRWRVRNLVEHVARIHHWAAGQACRQQETPLGRGPFVLTDFYAACAEEVLTTLRSLPPDAPAWTLDDSGTVSFWHRRQMLETLVHLWDLRTAGGLPLDVDPVIWADAVDEVVTVMQPRQERMGRMEPLEHRVALESDDVAQSWVLGGGDRVPAVVVRGSAQALALTVWGRGEAYDAPLTIDGDSAALTAALGSRLTP
jgi:uncharacterized protein (TIGR03083 family)